MEKLKHVAIIVDGNGRWAKERGKSRSEGHLEGSKTLERIILHTARNTDIKVLSLYVFSTENFGRAKEEVDYLMNLFLKWFTTSSKKYAKEDIKILFSGRKEPLSDKVYNAMKDLEERTKDRNGLIVNFCLNYGGRAEIVDATKRIIRDNIDIDCIDEKLFSKYMYQELPDVDFMIRTSGEVRLSNFLLWELSYAEFYFPEIKFPDFKAKDFEDALLVYNKRDRRFGGIKK